MLGRHTTNRLWPEAYSTLVSATGAKPHKQADQTDIKALNAKDQTGSEVHQTKERKSGETKSEVQKSDDKKSGQRKSDSKKPVVVMPSSQQWPNSSG